MKTCKVKPSASECRMCADTADHFNGMQNCGQCPYKNVRYELVGITTGIFNDYAFVQRNGKISKAYLNNIYDIKEE